MIESISFTNFKALRNTTLPLGRFTLLVGPNGSGKTTALRAFDAVRNPRQFTFRKLVSVGALASDQSAVEVVLTWSAAFQGARTYARWRATEPRTKQGPSAEWRTDTGQPLPPGLASPLKAELDRVRVYSLDPVSLASPVTLEPNSELRQEKGQLAGVLDRLRDQEPERFDALNRELGRMLPEFDRILFETPRPGHRVFLLRTQHGRHPIPATDLSEGTLLALAVLTLAYLHDPPPLIGLEEPDRSIHPRLLREVRDALYRLCYPEQFGETRPGVQVVATTHSPYFLDLFKDHPEEIVIAQKEGLEARFERLVDRPDIDEILADAPLGEVWYSGVLGGVPG
jgi:predicted ATPase